MAALRRLTTERHSPCGVASISAARLRCTIPFRPYPCSSEPYRRRCSGAPAHQPSRVRVPSEPWPIASPGRPARTSSSTPTTPSTGSRGVPTRSPAAKLLDRPIFLSIGYAACHWCHVMERESFEHEPTARYLNDHFVAIKVDREERPDLDQVYMAAVQAMTGGGGWPMSVFLTPDGRPFYGGTYFPDEPRHGMPSFRQVLEGVDRAWREQRAEVEAAGGRLVAGPGRRSPGSRPAPDDPTAELLDAATAAIEASFDCGQRRLGPRAQVPAADDHRVPAAPAPSRPAIRDRSWSRAARSTRWPTAGCATSSAAGSIATRPTRTGSSRTSSRCSTTTPSSPGSTCTPGALTGDARYSRSRPGRSTTCSAS